MSVLAEPKYAWEPFTPRGVAAFARASFERLLVVQILFALVAAFAVTWVLSDGIFPTIDAAINALPDTGEIRSRQLNWGGDAPVLLAEGNILAFSVDLEHGGSVRSPADFQFEFGRRSIRVFSLFGEGWLEYPPNCILGFNQRDARPAWGAWAPEILALTAIGTFVGLLLVWTALATVYCVPVWVFCFFSNRDLSLCASWRLAAATLLPGAALISLALGLYELGVFDLIQLLFAYALHLVVGWIYLFVSPMFLNRVLAKEKKNPFAGAKGG